MEPCCRRSTAAQLRCETPDWDRESLAPLGKQDAARSDVHEWQTGPILHFHRRARPADVVPEMTRIWLLGNTSLECCTYSSSNVCANTQTRVPSGFCGGRHLVRGEEKAAKGVGGDETEKSGRKLDLRHVANLSMGTLQINKKTVVQLFRRE